MLDTEDELVFEWRGKTKIKDKRFKYICVICDSYVQ
jgi:hypothetical protein